LPKNHTERSISASHLRADELDLMILQILIENGDISHRELAEKIGADIRTIDKHVNEMKKRGVLKITAEVNWPLLGVGAYAFVGTQTGLGKEAAQQLYDYIKKEPRVIEAYSTLGSDEYFFTVLETDFQALREEVLRELEPLTADLSTAIVSTRIKTKNYGAFIAFLGERAKANTNTELSQG